MRGLADARAGLGDLAGPVPVAEGQAQGVLEPGDPERAGIVLFATLQGIATLTNGRVLEPELLDGILETAVEQFLRGMQRR